MADLTQRQRTIFAAVVRATMDRIDGGRRPNDRWYRAGQSGIGHPRGEAVTLASLHTKGLLERRAWRGDGTNSRNDAFEYRPSAPVREALAIDPTSGEA